VAQSPRLRANLLLLLASMIWGFAFAAQRMGAEFVGPFTFNSVRFMMGAGVLVAVIAIVDRVRKRSKQRRRAATKAVIVPGLICGALLTAAVGLQQAAMSYTTAGNAAFITGLYIVLVPLAGLFRGQRPGWTIWVALPLAVTGLYLIAVQDSFEINLGDALVLGSAFCFAVQIQFVDYYSRRLSALRFSASQFFFCSVTSGVVALFIDAAPFTGLDQAVIPVLYTGILSVGLAYTLQVFGQRDALPSVAALIMSMEAVFGGLGGWLLLGEDMGLRGYCGAALMCLGILVSQLGTPTTEVRSEHVTPKGG
jgi:drug/metabolite transporter (DMT)-like permease